MTELYNHTGDDGTGLSALDDYENVNLAPAPENAGLVRELTAQLRGHFDPTYTAAAAALKTDDDGGRIPGGVRCTL